ncbi:MAG: hypothetical protein Q8M26_05930 [Pseudolabrys sp.]|nr:hypothetical protein [Pseudolabrys sp.]
MADYFPLIARAVAGLDKNTGENRRALYDRARTALVNQLRGVEPALDESDITRERLALEEAIRRLEADASKRPRPDAEDESKPGSLRDQGLRDFRETVAEAEGLGEAAAEANRSAQATYNAVPGDKPTSYFSGEQAEDLRGPEAGQDTDKDSDKDTDQDRGDERGRPAGVAAPPPFVAPLRAGMPDDGAAHDANDTPARAASDGSWRNASASASALPPAPDGFGDDLDDAYARPPRDYGRIIKIAVVLLLIAGVAAAGYWQREAISTMVASLTSPTPAEPPPQQAATPAGTPKITDRVSPSGETGPASATAPASAVAQKVVLYDEDTADPQGKRYVGSAIWRTETVSPGPGMAPELAIRADVEIPERRLRMTWSLRRNTDKALPASHTIEVMFTLPADFDQGGIGNVPGVLMKQNEQARGVPLAGLAVKVTNGYFLIGLSAVEVDVQRNIQLLKERDWFDIPIAYASGKRAIMALEKGIPGTRVFEEAFRAWGQ